MGAAAALVAVVALIGWRAQPAPVDSPVAFDYQVAPQDAADDALLRDIEALLAQDPYDFGFEVWAAAPNSGDREADSWSGIQLNEV
jgi:hypothetical protein